MIVKPYSCISCELSRVKVNKPCFELCIHLVLDYDKCKAEIVMLMMDIQLRLVITYICLSACIE